MASRLCYNVTYHEGEARRKVSAAGTAAGAVQGFINGKAIGPAVAAAITAATAVCPMVVIGNRSANQVIATIDYIQVEQDR